MVAGRDPGKGADAVARLLAETENEAVVFSQLDLGSLASLDRWAREYLASGKPPHVLVGRRGQRPSRRLEDPGAGRPDDDLGGRRTRVAGVSGKYREDCAIAKGAAERLRRAGEVPRAASIVTTMPPTAAVVLDVAQPLLEDWPQRTVWLQMSSVGASEADQPAETLKKEASRGKHPVRALRRPRERISTRVRTRNDPVDRTVPGRAEHSRP
ncbi:MAG TPA: hypothetical protein VMF09_15645 [Solirubrobacteraceae bacterium]|nr:hypothetical protein [Solirubrobacteraceae bacterium]